jgi:hypothetical protein
VVDNYVNRIESLSIHAMAAENAIREWTLQGREPEHRATVTTKHKVNQAIAESANAVV